MASKTMFPALPTADELFAYLFGLFRSENPLRPWAVTLAACALACLPLRTRRIGAVMFFAALAACGLFLFVQRALHDYTPR